MTHKLNTSIPVKLRLFNNWVKTHSLGMKLGKIIPPMKPSNTIKPNLWSVVIFCFVPLILVISSSTASISGNFKRNTKQPCNDVSKGENNPPYNPANEWNGDVRVNL